MKKIAKKGIAVFTCAAMAATMLLAGCGQNATPDETDTGSVNVENTDTSDKKDETPTLQKVTLNEVAHSIFYAPMYVAIEQGYFNDAGIDLNLVTGFGADKVMTAVLSGEADIGFMGPETTVYTANEGSKDPVVNFAQLTQRAGNFLVARKEITDFEWSDLVGKDVLGGRAGGMPEMIFEYILKQNGIDPSDVNINQSIDFGSTGAAFTGGQGEYTVEFEPGATLLEQEKAGYVPYTAFSAKTSYMEKHPNVIQAFTDALQKGMEYVNTHTPEEIASSIQPQFSETDTDTITTIIRRYQEQDTWKTDLVFSEDSFELLLDILESAGQLEKRPDYKDVVTTEYAEKALQ